MPADPITLAELRTGTGVLVGDTSSTAQTDIDRVVNESYIELANRRAYWRMRSTTITLTSGTLAYDLPSSFDSIFRLYYRQSGQYKDVEVVSDSQWLDVSATRAADAGYPKYARITQTSATLNRVELTPPPSSGFISNVSSTLTLEYFIEITRLSSATDEPILPANLRHHIIYLAGYKYSLFQGDNNLADRLKPDAIFAKAEILKNDLTRTGRPRQLRPRGRYWPQQVGVTLDYGEA